MFQLVALLILLVYFTGGVLLGHAKGFDEGFKAGIKERNKK